MDMKEAEKKIKAAIDQNGEYTHNLISLVLSRTARELGFEMANKLIKKYKLDERFGIFPIEGKDNERREGKETGNLPGASKRQRKATGKVGRGKTERYEEEKEKVTFGTDDDYEPVEEGASEDQEE